MMPHNLRKRKDDSQSEDAHPFALSPTKKSKKVSKLSATFLRGELSARGIPFSVDLNKTQLRNLLPRDFRTPTKQAEQVIGETISEDTSRAMSDSIPSDGSASPSLTVQAPSASPASAVSFESCLAAQDVLFAAQTELLGSISSVTNLSLKIRHQWIPSRIPRRVSPLNLPSPSVRI